jgi:hypothetical protein
VLVFASDRGLLSTAARPHGSCGGARQGASLDHAVWLHAPARFDGWMLYASDSPVAVAGRALAPRLDVVARRRFAWRPWRRKVSSASPPADLFAVMPMSR